MQVVAYDPFQRGPGVSPGCVAMSNSMSGRTQQRHERDIGARAYSVVSKRSALRCLREGEGKIAWQKTTGHRFRLS